MVYLQASDGCPDGTDDPRDDLIQLADLLADLRTHLSMILTSAAAESPILGSTLLEPSINLNEQPSNSISHFQRSPEITTATMYIKHELKTLSMGPSIEA